MPNEQRRMTKEARMTKPESTSARHLSFVVPGHRGFGFRHSSFVIALLLPGLLLAREKAAAPKVAPQPVAAATSARHADSVVRVNITSQAWDFIRPWSKKAPGGRRGLGAVLDGGRVLVTGEMVANATYIELEKPESGEKSPARVVQVDYEANLALIEPSDAHFLDAFKPLPLRDAAVGDQVSMLQLESTGAQVATSALVTTVEVRRYPAEDISLISYRLSSPMQYRENSFTLPVVKGGALTGVLMRYDQRQQTADLVPAPVIAHFLKAAQSKEYGGFPRAGVGFAPMRDPQLRHYAGLDGGGAGGIYITEVLPKGPAAEAGIKVGDVVLSVDGHDVDQDGNYNDDLYGKLSIHHLLTTQHFDGERAVFKILRDGKPQEIAVTLRHRNAGDYVIPPYSVDEQPHYYVLGGLVLTELSRQFLKEWGADWDKKAPERFVYYDRYQGDLFQDGQKRVVILTQVMATPLTIGYEQLNGLVVTKINGVELKSLADVEKALAQPVNGFHKIEFNDDPAMIFLDAAEVEKEAGSLRRDYRLPSLKHL
jgi:S1-C subfamily serine protease